MNISKLRPLHDRVVIKRNEALAKSVGGIIIPETAKDKPQEGTVVATGPGKVLENGKRLEPSVKRGDKVLFTKYAALEIPGDKEHLVVKEEDILGVEDV